MITTLLTKIQRQRLFAPGETVVVAVSGGADSVALLDLLVQLENGRLNLVVAHLNHCLRGAASDGDEEFVRELAAGHSLPFVTQRSDVALLAESSRISLEDAGRQARYAFFDETAKAHAADSIAVAHHLDDQAETVLIRLLRGAGGAGLSGMSSLSRGMIKRPLLQISRAEIEEYLKIRGLTYRTDATNSDTAILRNSIRHELLPLLKKYNPNVSERLAATAEILAGDEELLDRLTEAEYASVARSEPASVVLDGAALAEKPRALRLRLYRRALAEQRGHLKAIALVHLDAIDGLVTSGRPNARVDLPGCFVERSYENLRFRFEEEPPQEGWRLDIEGEGNYLLPTGHSIAVKLVPRPLDLTPPTPAVAYLDPKGTPFPWVLRTFLDGDRFTPLGMEGEQKIKELFINEKVPPPQRRRIPLLVSGGKIVWVAGMKLGEKGRVQRSTTEVLRVEIPDFTP